MCNIIKSKRADKLPTPSLTNPLNSETKLQKRLNFQNYFFQNDQFQTKKQLSNQILRKIVK